jgi:maltose alpha-D-glucosyltransferase/alpha-amylase
VPTFTIAGDWNELFKGASLKTMEATLFPAVLARSGWKPTISRAVRRASICDIIPLSGSNEPLWAVMIDMALPEGRQQRFCLPLAVAVGAAAREIEDEYSTSILARVQRGDERGVLYDGSFSGTVQRGLLDLVARRKRVRGRAGALSGVLWRSSEVSSDTLSTIDHSARTELRQRNVFVEYDHNLLLKLYRALDQGVPPELELMRFLRERAGYDNIPPIVGTIIYSRRGAPAATAALLERYVPNQGNGWAVTRYAVGNYLEQILSGREEELEGIEVRSPLTGVSVPEIPEYIHDRIGGVFLEQMNLLGIRTAELHRALASDDKDEAFAPENFSQLYRRSLYQSFQALVRKTMGGLEKKLKELNGKGRLEASAVLGMRGRIVEAMRAGTSADVDGVKMRIHGNLHLGHIIYTGRDFVFSGFGGDPLRPLGERRLKYSPLRDLASLMRSIHEAAWRSLTDRHEFRSRDVESLAPWLMPWAHAVTGELLRAYLAVPGIEALIPGSTGAIRRLVGAYMLAESLERILDDVRSTTNARLLGDLRALSTLLEALVDPEES